MIYAFSIRIDLLEPLLVTGVLNGEENSRTSLPYVPGSALRGVCASRFASGLTNGQSLETDVEGRQLFFEEKLFFLNGYPAHPHRATRSLPRPLSWRMGKKEGEGENRELQDFAYWLDDKADINNPKVEQRLYFWQGQQAKEIDMVSPKWTVTVHNASDAPLRKERGNSTVFRYEALAPKQTFIAYVVSEEEALLEKAKALLPNGRYHLGGSQSAGYGSALVRVGEIESWSGESATYSQNEWLEAYTVITLLSDALLLGDDLQPTTDFHRRLGEELGMDSLKRPLATFARTTLVGGFNRKWGFPLPQHQALAMGSTFVYDAVDLPAEKLESLVQTGFGERRAEGFGRLGVNIHVAETFNTNPVTSAQPASSTISDTNKGQAAKIAERFFLNTVSKEINKYTSQMLWIDTKQPENSQLSQIRLVVRRAQQTHNLALITHHLNDLKQAKAQFDSRIKPPNASRISWRTWLTERAEKEDGLLQLEIDPTEDRYQLAGVAPTITNGLKVNITCQLIEAVVYRALKESSNE